MFAFDYDQIWGRGNDCSSGALQTYACGVKETKKVLNRTKKLQDQQDGEYIVNTFQGKTGVSLASLLANNQ